MASATPSDVFMGHLKAYTERFARERDKHKRRALLLRLSTAVLAAAATVLLGWEQSGYPIAFKNLALLANAAITVLAAYEVFFEPRKLWVRETGVLNALKDLQRDVEFDVAGGGLDGQRLSEYRERLTKLLQGSLDEWLQDKASGR